MGTRGDSGSALDGWRWQLWAGMWEARLATAGRLCSPCGVLTASVCADVSVTHGLPVARGGRDPLLTVFAVPWVLPRPCPGCSSTGVNSV